MILGQARCECLLKDLKIATSDSRCNVYSVGVQRL